MYDIASLQVVLHVLIKKKGVFFDRRRRTSLLHQQKQQVAVCLERYLEKL